MQVLLGETAQARRRRVPQHELGAQSHVHGPGPRAHARQSRKVTAVGFEPTPLRTGAWSQRLRPLGQTVLGVSLAKSSSLTVARPRSAQVTRVTLRAKQPRSGRVARSRGLVVDVFGGLRKALVGVKDLSLAR